MPWEGRLAASGVIVGAQNENTSVNQVGDSLGDFGHVLYVGIVSIPYRSPKKK